MNIESSALLKSSYSRSALLVISCDRYSDLWSPFFEAFFKNWSDCPFNVYLLTNYLDYKSNYPVKVLKVGEDISWSDNLLAGLEQLDNYKHVFLMLEDMFIDKCVNTNRVNTILSEFYKLNGTSISFLNEPKCSQLLNKYFGVIGEKSIYRVTVTFTLWNIVSLLSILKSGESAWDFEKKGPVRARSYKNICSVQKNEISFIHGVIKGKWLPSAINSLRKIGINVELSDRVIIPLSQELRFRLYQKLRFFAFKVIPAYLIRKIFSKTILF